VSLRGRDCAPLLLHRIVAEIFGSRARRGLIERNAAKIEGNIGGQSKEGSGSEGLKVNGLRGFEGSSLARDTASSAGSRQPADSGCRSLDRARRPSCLNQVCAVEKVGSYGAGRKRGARAVRPRPRPRQGRLGIVQGRAGQRGEGRWSCFGVRIVDDRRVARSSRTRRGVLIPSTAETLSSAKQGSLAWRPSINRA
jgi:hypothetical protein